MIFGVFQKVKYIIQIITITIFYLIIIFLYKLYRIYFGGFKKKLFCLIIYLNIAIIIQYILVILCNLTSEVLVVFCIISYFKGFKYLNDIIMEIKLFVEPILSIPIGILDILVLIDAIKLYRYFNSIRNDFYKINQKNQNENEQNATDLDYFSYISLNNDYQCLYEYRNNEAFPNVTKCFYYIPNEMINKGKHEHQESKENLLDNKITNEINEKYKINNEITNEGNENIINTIDIKQENDIINFQNNNNKELENQNIVKNSQNNNNEELENNNNITKIEINDENPNTNDELKNENRV